VVEAEGVEEEETSLQSAKKGEEQDAASSIASLTFLEEFVRKY
jgi:hypothetical protein